MLRRPVLSFARRCFSVRTIDILVPPFPEAVQDGEVVEPLPTVGQQLNQGDSAFALNTAKGVLYVPAPEAGVLTRVAVKLQQTVTPGQVLGTLQAGGDKPASQPAPAAATSTSSATAAPAASASTAPSPSAAPTAVTGRAHRPLIRFRYGKRDVPSAAAAPTQVSRTIPTPASLGGMGLSGPAPGLDMRDVGQAHLPPRFRRQLLSQEEMDAVESGGASLIKY